MTKDPAAVAPLDGTLSLAADVPSVGVRPEGTGPERTSGYTVYVDLPDDPERMLLVHNYTGAYDRVSRRVATWLRAQESGPVPKPLYGAWSPEPTGSGHAAPPSDATIEKLRRRGYLTRMTREEETEFFGRVAARLHHVARHRQPGYVLMTTYQCNLRCPYCFQDHMRTDPKYRHLLRFMDRPMVDRIWKGMDEIDRAHGVEPDQRGPRNITLFGGEPLLREARPVVEYLLERGQQGRGASFSAISNATELDAYEDLLGPHAIQQIQVTIDGPPDQHDKRRIYADGSGSFERIADNVTLALSRGVRIAIRMNIDRTNIEQLPRLAEVIEARWGSHPNLHAYVAPVHDPKAPRTTLDSWQLGRAIEDLQRQFPAMALIHTQDDSLVRRVRQLFTDRADALTSFRASFCGAHSTMYVIDAFGDLYACWERTGDQRIRMGAIGADGTVAVSDAVMRLWRNRTVASNPTCQSCRYATYCGGGCAAYAEQKHGTMYHNYCDGFQKRFRSAVAEAWSAHQRGAPLEEPAVDMCIE
jgi:uncharacterized protein